VCLLAAKQLRRLLLPNGRKCWLLLRPIDMHTDASTPAMCVHNSCCNAAIKSVSDNATPSTGYASFNISGEYAVKLRTFVNQQSQEIKCLASFSWQRAAIAILRLHTVAKVDLRCAFWSSVCEYRAPSMLLCELCFSPTSSFYCPTLQAVWCQAPTRVV
jgi:hypothetical protein